ncbi:hypothetical protein D3C81_1819470 [compost metagenome]
MSVCALIALAGSADASLCELAQLIDAGATTLGCALAIRHAGLLDAPLFEEVVSQECIDSNMSVSLGDFHSVHPPTVNT